MVKRREPATRHKSEEEYNSFIEAAEAPVKTKLVKPALDPNGDRLKKITITVNEFEDDRMLRAARAHGMTKTAFMRMAVATAAREILD